MSTTDTVFARQWGKRRDTIYYRNNPQRVISHPWLTSVFRSSQEEVDGFKGVWAASILPGFVNGLEPLYRQKKIEKRMKNGVLQKVEVETDVSLLDGPEIVIPDKGAYYAGTDIRLPFFEEMGAGASSSGVTVGESGVTIDASKGTQKRYLLQSVIYLSVARATQRLEATIPGNLVAGDTVDYQVIYDTRALQASGGRARIEISGVMPEPPPAGTIGRLYEDSGFDYLKIATVYFVSPKGFSPSTEKDATPYERGVIPDEKWEPYVGHNLFWNVFHGPKTEPPFKRAGGLLDASVAAFAGRYTLAVGAIAASIDAALDEALAMAFNDASNRGRFWTA